MAQRYKFSIESKSFPLDISGEPTRAKHGEAINESFLEKGEHIYY